MLPDMTDALSDWSDTYIVKAVTTSSVNFVETKTITGRSISAVVQPASPETLNKDQIDWHKRYIMIHSSSHISVNEYIEYEGEDYKIISPQNYGSYTAAVGEQTKKDKLVINA